MQLELYPSMIGQQFEPSSFCGEASSSFVNIFFLKWIQKSQNSNTDHLCNHQPPAEMFKT